MIKVPFKELEPGDLFKHNTFIFEKRDPGIPYLFSKPIGKGKRRLIGCNATCLDDWNFCARFAPHVKVAPLPKDYEKN